MKKPTKEEIARFVQVFDLLSRFEAQQRLIRRMGALNPEGLPIPEVVTVLAWLRHMAHEEIRALGQCVSPEGK